MQNKRVDAEFSSASTWIATPQNVARNDIQSSSRHCERM